MHSSLVVETQAVTLLISLSKSDTVFHVAETLYGLVKIPMTSLLVPSELMTSGSDAVALMTTFVIFRSTIEIGEKPSIMGGVVSTTRPLDDEVVDKPAPLMAVTVTK